MLGEDDAIQVAGAGLLWTMGSDAQNGYAVRQAIPEVHVWELVRSKTASRTPSVTGDDELANTATTSPDSKNGEPATM